jgi:hypothetical protein
VTAEVVLPDLPNLSAVAAEAALGTSSLCFDTSNVVTLTQTRVGAPQTTNTPFLDSNTSYQFDVNVNGAAALWDGSTLHLSSAATPLEILPLQATIQLRLPSADPTTVDQTAFTSVTSIGGKLSAQ